jgi:hypothetical protein
MFEPTNKELNRKKRIKNNKGKKKDERPNSP